MLHDVGCSIIRQLAIPVAGHTGHNFKALAFSSDGFLEASSALHGGVNTGHALNHRKLAAIFPVGNEPTGGTHAIVFLHVANVVLGRGNDGIVDVDDGNTGLFGGFNSRLQV